MNSWSLVGVVLAASFTAAPPLDAASCSDNKAFATIHECTASDGSRSRGGGGTFQGARLVTIRLIAGGGSVVVGLDANQRALAGCQAIDNVRDTFPQSTTSTKCNSAVTTTVVAQTNPF
ncbi:MAG: hypothetical protein RL033_5062 [Pseudomonadota bacterium]|jgi:hypothetical protein